MYLKFEKQNELLQVTIIQMMLKKSKKLRTHLESGVVSDYETVIKQQI